MMWIFFFQAEDGIRDKLVTGVQTCALPIWPSVRGAVRADVDGTAVSHARDRLAQRRREGHGRGVSRVLRDLLRAQQHREIGRASCREKCRSRWSPYD